MPASADRPRRPHGTEKTPLTRSGVVAARPEHQTGFSAVADKTGSLAHRVARRRGDSEPPSLMPYQARLDVDMDDTAVSKVRDPSSSIRLGPDGDLVDLRVRAGPSTPVPDPSRLGLTSVALGGGFGVLVVALAVLVARWASAPEPVVAVPAALTPVSAPTEPTSARVPAPGPAVAACAIRKAPRELATATDTPPVVRASADGGAVAIGYSKIPGQAMGLVVEPKSLRSEVAFRQWKREIVSQVAPVSGDGEEQRFAVHRGVYRSWEETTLPALPEARIRASRSGVVILRGSAKPETLWPLAAERVGAIAVVASGLRHLVLIRTEAPAAAYAGWLDAGGHAVSPLQSVSAGVEAVIDAAVAVRGDEALFALRAKKEGRQRVLLTLWSAQQGPRPATEIAVDARDGKGGDLGVAALPVGWWVQWPGRDEAGQAGLVGAPVGEGLDVGKPLLLHSPAVEARGVGVVAVGSDVVSVMSSGAGAGHTTLWATTIGCG